MAKVVGFIKNVDGIVKVKGVDGTIREVAIGDKLYEGETIIGGADAEVEVKYLALEDSVTYQDAFEVLLDDSVLAEINGAIDNIDTAAGEEAVVESSSNYFIEDDVYLGVDGPQGLGIVDTGVNPVEPNPTTPVNSQTTPPPLPEVAPDQAAPEITSSNFVIFDENDDGIVIQVTATDANAVTYTIEDGLDSALFSINTLGEVSFDTAPNFENPQDGGENNEYHINVTAQDTSGNFTTQAITIAINNVNEAPVAVDDTAGNGNGIVNGAVIQGEIIDVNDAESDESFVSVDHIEFLYNGGPLSINMLSENGDDSYDDGELELPEIGTNLDGEEGEPYIRNEVYTDIDGDGVQTYLDTEIYLYKYNEVTESWDYVAHNDDAGYNDDEEDGYTEDINDDWRADGSVNNLDSYLSFEDGDLTPGTYKLSISSYDFDDTEGLDSYQDNDDNEPGVYQATINGDIVILEAPVNANVIVNNANGESIIYENDTTSIDVLSNDTDVDAGDNPSTFILNPLLSNDEYGVFSVSDNKIVFTAGDNFDYLAVGESKIISVDYTMSDDGGLSSNSATLTLTVTGTNDQPTLSDININNFMQSWIINSYEDANDIEEDNDTNDTNGASVEEIEALYNINDSDVSVYSLVNELNENGADINIGEEGDGGEVDGSALKITLNTDAGETVSFNWNFIDAEDDSEYNDFAYVVVDGQEISLLSLVENSVEDDSGVFTYTFEEAGTHEIVFAVINDEDDEVDSSLEVEYVSGGRIESVETVGYVEPLQSSDTLTGAMLESELIDRFGMDNFFQVIDQDTLLEAANLTDLDITDTHTLELATIMGEDIDLPMSADAEFVFNQEGDFEQDGGVLQVTQEFLDEEENIDAQVGDFIFFGEALNTLGVGESATLTFDIVANDGTDDANGESNLSEAQTVTLSIVGTNDQPTIEAVDLGTMLESDVDDLEDYGVYNYFSLIDTATLLEGADIQDMDINDTHTLEFANAVVGEDGALYSDDAKFTGDYTTDGGFDEENSYGVMQVTEAFLETETASDLGLTLDNVGEFVLYGYGIDTLGQGETTTLTFDIVANDGTDDANGESNLSEAQTVTLSIVGTNDQPTIEAVIENASETDFTDVPGYNNFTYNSSIDLSNINDIDTNDTHTFALSSFDGSYGYDEVGVQVKLVQSDTEFLSVYQAAENGDTNAFIALQVAFVAMVSSPLVAAMIEDSSTLVQLVNDINNATTVTEVEAVIDGTTGFALEEVYNDSGLVSVDLIAEATPAQTTSLQEEGYLVVDVNEDGTYNVSTPFVDALAEGEVAELTFGYTVNDGTVDSEVNTVTLHVDGSDDAPVVETIDNTTISIFDVDGGSVDLSTITTETTVDNIILAGKTEINISLSDVLDINDSNELLITSADDTNDTIHLSDEFTNNNDGTYTATDSITTVIITIEDTIVVD